MSDYRRLIRTANYGVKEFEQDRIQLSELKSKCEEFNTIIDKLKTNDSVVKAFLMDEIQEFYRKKHLIRDIQHKINVYNGVVNKVLIPKIEKSNLEIEQLKKTIPSYAVSMCCLFKYQSFYQSDEVSSEVFSNFLINSMLISLLCDKEIDVDSYGLLIKTTLKKIDKLRRENKVIKQHIQKYTQKIDDCKNKIDKIL